MLAMACALVGSSLWLSLATRIGAPVSTTHSIVGAIIGAGIAANGADGVQWGWGGFSQIVASWFIAPAIAGAFAGILFMFTKYTVLERKNSLRNAFYIIPVYFFLTFSVLTMVIVWKGAPNLKLDKLSTGATVGSIFGVGAVSVILYFLFWYPFLYRLLVLEDWTLKKYHVILGPLLWRRGDVPPIPAGEQHNIIIDYYEGRRTEEEIQAARLAGDIGVIGATGGPSPQNNSNSSGDVMEYSNSITDEEKELGKKLAVETNEELPQTNIHPKLEKLEKFNFKKALVTPKLWPLMIWKAFIHGIDVDVLSSQNEHSRLAGDVSDMHERAKKYDNKTEHLYTFLQAITACTASFAHGSNDISNACSPLSTIYLVWKHNKTMAKADVPVWVLCYAAAALVIGLWTYGYNIMRNLGNRLTLQSPARGFSMELGAAVTTVFATRLSIPVSTTQCIVGAVVVVGLCNKDIKAVNWRMVTWCYLGWIFTLPCAGLISGILMGIIVNAPRAGVNYSLTN